MSITSTSFRKPIAGFVEAASGTGMAVTGNSNMIPSVAAGNYWVGGIRVVYAGGTVTLNAAHATLARIDLICADNAGTITAVTGTPAASPTAPFAPENRIILARIAVAAGTTSITNANITDLRDLGGISVDGTTISISSGGVLSVNQSGLNQFPSVVAAGSGTTAITGNGSAQNVFTDTWTALAVGETVDIEVHLQLTATLGLDTPDAVLSSSGVTLDTLASMNPGASPNFVTWKVSAGYHSTANRGYLLTLRKAQGAALTAPTEAGTLTTALAALTLTIDPAVGTNINASYSYRVIKYGTGV